jgi:orotate phosphoribosyltransferase/AMMECR1 domain-containing protein
MQTLFSSLSEEFQADRQELLGMLLGRGILYQTPTQPVLSRDGTSARWMLDSLAVTTQPRGAELAGRCMLELLKQFDGKQIATYGLTGVPILQSCILQSGGKYRGLLLRKERKKHGSLKLIEGQIDPHEPTILIDDSVSSGLSMEEGCKLLEDAGLRVEGGVALVRFGWYGGYALMQERGYHMQALYDIWDDFMTRMEGEQVPLANPSKWFPEFNWSAKQAAENLHPAHLARAVLLEYADSGELLRPPMRFEGDHDGAGGVWVSLRSRDNIYLRHNRDGFWHFPGEERWSAAEDLVRACLRTGHGLPRGEEGRKLIESSSIAVTFFSELEECTVGELDNDRYGIVVRSRERTSRMGGALPRMPGIGNEWQQFQHARRKNGELLSFEPYVIFRHEVTKSVEPDAVWQPSGVPLKSDVPWHQDRAVCGPLALRARDILIAKLFGVAESTPPLARDFAPAKLDSLYVTVYVRGRMRGCMGSVLKNLDEDIRKLALLAAKDDRFADEPAGHQDEIAVSVSLLFNPLDLGDLTPDEVAVRSRHGQQALMVYQGNRVGLLLPFVATTHNLSRSEFVAEVIDKAGITRPPYNWCRFDCATWLADAAETVILEGGFRRPPEPPPLKTLLDHLGNLQVEYLTRQQAEDGSLYLRYEPFQNRLYYGLSAPRLAHGTWIISRAWRAFGGDDLKTVRDKLIEYHLKRVRETDDGVWLVEDESTPVDSASAQSGSVELPSEQSISVGASGASNEQPSSVESPGSQSRSDDPPSVSELSFLLLTLAELPETGGHAPLARKMASTLWSCIDAHGRIATHRDAKDGGDVYQDYFPGQALLALASAHQSGLTEIIDGRLDNAFKYYRHRFRYRRNFGQVSWLMQAFAKWWEATGDRAFADFVFEIGDWVLQHQQAKTGAFINDHQSDSPGYTTALYLEGIAVAARVAASSGDPQRHDRYLESLTRGFAFVDRITIQQRDASLLPNPEFAIGGLRQSLYASEIRVDFVQHSLSAILDARVARETRQAAASTPRGQA